jgi:hypothetical protein
LRDELDRLRHLLDKYRRALKNSQDALDASKRDATPLFEVGKCYRTKDGRVVEVHDNGTGSDYPLFHCEPGTWDGSVMGSMFHAITATGRSCVGLEDYDLLPGPVDPPPSPPTWKAPASLPDGKYEWDGSILTIPCDSLVLPGVRSYLYRDWTDPPKEGLWLVKDGIGTWQGEV